MGISVSIREGTRVQSLEVQPGRSAREILSSAAAFTLDAPCGGKGLCGKCRVIARGEELSEPDERERELLSEAELAAGERLACRLLLHGNAELYLPEARQPSILVQGGARDFAIRPPVRRVVVTPSPPSLEDQRDDERRLLEALARSIDDRPLHVPLAALSSLARAMREPGGLSVLVAEGEVLDLRAGSEPPPCLGVAIDIGTTTIVCFLLDLATGEELGLRSALNAQRSFGADVISRIAASTEGPGGLEALRAAIAGQLARIIAALAEGAGRSLGNVAAITVAGNSTMLHLLAGVSPAAIASAPFIPAFLGTRRLAASELGLVPHAACRAFLLPGLSGYVGADIVAGMAAVRMGEREGPALFLDLGTNGEIALGDRSGIRCCSTAAGPAFEGAGIEMGMAGVAGAIDAVWLEDGELHCSTIGGEAAAGICGSGIIDAVATLLDCGLVDETGRIVDAGEAASLPSAIAAVRSGEGRDARILIDAARGVYLSQGDIRAVQLAKAAVAAGIGSLVHAAGIELSSVSRLWLAGGFGSFIDLRSAIRIGLIPRELRDRVIVAGNTAGAGAIAACLSAERLAECERLPSICTYLELSSRPDFNEIFVDNMVFPERRQ
ncbi:MAG TPA: ASKHA domain-containing protein [Rectinemataceae bacterium]|nr:ASKHA domain-containing protein [Rectinemataceae bacterium]